MSSETLFGFMLAGALLIIGLGIMVYVIVSVFKKMRTEYNETGFYPYGYFSMKGSMYSIPLAIGVGYLLLPYYESMTKWSSLPFVVAVCLPGMLLGYILERKNKEIVRPRTEAEKRRRDKANLLAAILLTALILYRIFIIKR